MGGIRALGVDTGYGRDQGIRGGYMIWEGSGHIRGGYRIWEGSGHIRAFLYPCPLFPFLS